MRQIPLRLVRHGRCAEPSTGALDASVTKTNEVFAPARLSFYVRSDECLDGSPWEAWSDEGDTKPVRWAEVRPWVQKLFPAAPSDAWPDSASKGLGAWLEFATAVWARSDEITVHLRRRGTRGVGSFPEHGRHIFFSPRAFTDLPYLFAHELGHYLGLRHTFSDRRGKDPRTGKKWPLAARWDLIYWPKKDVFFKSYAEALAVPEEELRLIQRYSGKKDASNSCSVNDSGELICRLEDSTVVSSGMPALAGMSFPEGSKFLVNIMNYMHSGDHGGRLSQSQIDMIHAYLSKDAPLDVDAKGLPKGVRQLWGHRPSLGLGSSPVSSVPVMPWLLGGVGVLLVGVIVAAAVSDTEVHLERVR